MPPCPIPDEGNKPGEEKTIEEWMKQTAWVMLCNMPRTAPTSMSQTISVTSTPSLATAVVSIQTPLHKIKYEDPVDFMNMTVACVSAMIFDETGRWWPSPSWAENDVSAAVARSCDPLWKALCKKAGMMRYVRTEPRGSETRADIIFEIHHNNMRMGLLVEMKNINATRWTGWKKLDDGLVNATNDGEEVQLKGFIKQVRSLKHSSS